MMTEDNGSKEGRKGIKITYTQALSPHASARNATHAATILMLPTIHLLTPQSRASYSIFRQHIHTYVRSKATRTYPILQERPSAHPDEPDEAARHDAAGVRFPRRAGRSGSAGRGAGAGGRGGGVTAAAGAAAGSAARRGGLVRRERG